VSTPASDNPSGTEEQSQGGLSDSVYKHLRAIAQAKLSGERVGHTLQATALVHEAYIRLDRAGLGPEALGPNFHRAAAEAMKRILIEHARARKAAKRGGGAQRLDWAKTIAGVADLADHGDEEQIAALDRAILRLQDQDARAAEVVRFRFFAGLTLDEAAESLGISPRSAKRDWEYARAWLLRELEPEGGAASEG
jgi:RNA polymerase sigma factor (TIGR02999 family)